MAAISFSCQNLILIAYYFLFFIIYFLNKWAKTASNIPTSKKFAGVGSYFSASLYLRSLPAREFPRRRGEAHSRRSSRTCPVLSSLSSPPSLTAAVRARSSRRTAHTSTENEKTERQNIILIWCNEHLWKNYQHLKEENLWDFLHEIFIEPLNNI